MRQMKRSGICAGPGPNHSTVYPSDFATTAHSGARGSTDRRFQSGETCAAAFFVGSPGLVGRCLCGVCAVFACWKIQKGAVCCPFNRTSIVAVVEK